jgi:hypothetical protein
VGEESSVPARPKSKVLRAAGGRFGLLLVALIALMATTPLVLDQPRGNLLLGLFTDVALVASLHAAQPGRRALAVGIALAVADLLIGRLVHVEGGWWLVALQAALWLATLVFVVTMILETMFESEDVTIETLQASLCVYLLFGLMWVFIYSLIDLAAPGSFEHSGGAKAGWNDPHARRVEFMRLFTFSYATLSGSDYGGLSAANEFSAIASSLEAMMGQIYLAVVIARLVGIQSSPPPAGRGPAP